MLNTLNRFEGWVDKKAQFPVNSTKLPSLKGFLPKKKETLLACI